MTTGERENAVKIRRAQILPTLTPAQQGTVSNIKALGGLEMTISIETNRKVNAILDKLTVGDLAAILPFLYTGTV